MFFVNFFFVACISALVAGDDYHWVPPTIPSVTKQCERAGYYDGVCNNAGFNDPAICKNILCAKSTGGSYIGTPIDAMEGTICGSSSVCKEHECVPVPHNKFPVHQYGLLIRGCKYASPSTGDNVNNKSANKPSLWEWIFD